MLSSHVSTPRKDFIPVETPPQANLPSDDNQSRELRLIYHLPMVPVNQVDVSPSEQHLESLEDAIFQVSELLAAMGSR